MDKRDQVEEISTRASGEAMVELQLNNIKKKWEELTFELVPYADYKNVFKITGVDEIFAILEDNSAGIQTMLSTRYVSVIKAEVEVWEKKLFLISEVLDEWLGC